jgi:hypothetical protein
VRAQVDREPPFWGDEMVGSKEGRSAALAKVADEGRRPQVLVEIDPRHASTATARRARSRARVTETCGAGGLVGIVIAW